MGATLLEVVYVAHLLVRVEVLMGATILATMCFVGEHWYWKHKSLSRLTTGCGILPFWRLAFHLLLHVAVTSHQKPFH